MGTWAAGPFGNDQAMDWIGETLAGLMEPIDAFLEEPEIDETFDEAFAALAVINEVIELSGARPWDDEASDVRAATPITTALLKCFDEQIDGMQPDPDYKAEQRAALVATCKRFEALVKG